MMRVEMVFKKNMLVRTISERLLQGLPYETIFRADMDKSPSVFKRFTRSSSSFHPCWSSEYFRIFNEQEDDFRLLMKFLRRVWALFLVLQIPR